MSWKGRFTKNGVTSVYYVPDSVTDDNALAWFESQRADMPTAEQLDSAKAANETYKTGAPTEDRTSYMGTRPKFDAGDLVQGVMPLASFGAKRDYNPVAVGAMGGVDALTLLAPPLVAARFAPAAIAGLKAGAVPLGGFLSRLVRPAIEGATGAAIVAPQEFAQTGEIGGGTAITGLAPIGLQGAGMALGGGLKLAGRGASSLAEMSAQGLESANAPALASTVRAGTERIRGISLPGSIAKEALTAELAADASKKIKIGESIGIAPEEMPYLSLFGEGRVAQGEKVAFADMSPSVQEKFATIAPKWQEGADKAIADLAGGAVLGTQEAGQMLREGIPEGVNRIIGGLDISHGKIIKQFPGLQVSTKGQDRLLDALISADDLSSMQAKFDLGGSDVNRIKAMSDAAMESGSYKDLNELRRVVGTEIGRMKGVEGSSVYLGKLRTLYGGINDALMETVDEAAPGMAAQLKESNSIISDVLKDDALFSATYGKDIGGEKVWNAAVNDSRKVQALRKLLTPEQFDAVRGAYVESGVNRLSEGRIGAAGFRSSLNNKNKAPVLNELFRGSEDRLEYLRDLASVGEDIQRIGAVEGIARTVVGKGGMNLSDIAGGVKDLATSDTRTVAAGRNIESKIAKERIAKIDAQMATASPNDAKILRNQRKALESVLLPEDLYQTPAFARPLSSLARLSRGAFYPTPSGEEQ